MQPLYIYRAIVLSVTDGDTIAVTIQLGFKATLEMKIRLYGINTPEVVGESRAEGLEAKSYLKERIEGKEVVLKTYRDKQEKFGRYLATVYLDDVDINQELIEKDLAKLYMR